MEPIQLTRDAERVLAVRVCETCIGWSATRDAKRARVRSSAAMLCRDDPSPLPCREWRPNSELPDGDMMDEADAGILLYEFELDTMGLVSLLRLP